MLNAKDYLKALKCGTYNVAKWVVPEIQIIPRHDGDFFFAGLPLGHAFNWEEQQSTKAILKQPEITTKLAKLSGILFNDLSNIDPVFIRAGWYNMNGIYRVQVSVSDYSLLIGLLSIYEDHLLRISKINEKTPGALLIALKDLCEQYGLLSVYDWRAEVNIVPMNQTPFCNSLYVGFTLSEMVDFMKNLYTLYLCWLYIDYGKQDIIQNLSYREGKDVVFFSKEGLDKKVDEALQNIQQRFTYKREVSYTGGKVNSTFYCETFVGAAMLQLLNLIGTNRTGRHNRTLASCSNCHTEFWRTHGNATLCDKCKENKEQVKRSRQRKKEDKDHGKETGE